jgi:hypothetical protein
MSDEFDDAPEPWPAGTERRRHDPRGKHAEGRAELVAQLFSKGGEQFRAKLLECLLRHLGPLGLVAVAAGAFGRFLDRGRQGLIVSPDDTTAFSTEQVLELARYVEQCSPDSFVQIGLLLAEHPVGMVGLSASVVLLALEAWRRRD